MLKLNSTGQLTENTYDLANDPKHSTLFGTGNGYFGVRGSLEEFGAVFIQGTYIRGVFDSIIEIPITFVDNEYMKKYYFDEQKLKEFEYEDSCINICDFLHLRIKIGEKTFYPWEGKIILWERTLDTDDGSLVRKVIWDDGEGNQTKIVFKRFASFSENHLYIINCKINALNHNLKITVQAGVDTFVKTNGQKKSKVKSVEQTLKETKIIFEKMAKYGHQVALNYSATFTGFDESSHQNKYDDGIYYDEITGTEKELEITKKVLMYANVDTKNFISKLNALSKKYQLLSYEEIYLKHLKAYSDAFKKIDIKIKGDDELDGYLRYANYQTLIGFDRLEKVHSLSAKNLTAEKYNQFVWWDCEIYQEPIFFATFPKESLALLEYRYNRLDAAIENAKLLNEKGAKFAFCSSVTGSENVWIYARHPFLQIHINSDIAYSVINYFHHTLDEDFLINKGLKINLEVMRYFANKLEKIDGKYHLNNVTGTDEHHPYINDNAYTNYTINYIFNESMKYIKKYSLIEKLNIMKEEEQLFIDICNNMELPLEENGMIPQFAGYFELSPTLELAGSGAGTSFQMKQAGLYHKSQVIKQPDVLVAYTYLNINMPGNYKDNFEYYEKMCEASSSLTYPVHAISAIDNADDEKFYDYLMKSIKIDILDMHNCAYQGVHAASMAGGWYGIYRGLFGFEAHEDYLIINPHYTNKFQSVKINFYYHGNKVEAILDNKKHTLMIKSNGDFYLKQKNNQELIKHNKKTIVKGEKND